MKRCMRSPMTLAALAAVVLTAPFAVTCDKAQPQELFIQDIMAMTSAQQCTVRPGQAAQAIRPYGRLDLMQTNQYWLWPRFRNMMNPLSTLTGENLQTPEVEGHYMSIQRAKVFVDIGEFNTGLSGNDARLRDKYSLDGVESFVAAGVAPLTEGVVAVQAIPPELGNVITGKMRSLIKTVESPSVWITLYVSIYGQTQSGEVIRSNEFSFPVNLCWGCLVYLDNSGQNADFPCFIGQDESIPSWACPFLANFPADCPFQ